MRKTCITTTPPSNRKGGENLENIVKKNHSENERGAKETSRGSAASVMGEERFSIFLGIVERIAKGGRTNARCRTAHDPLKKQEAGGARPPPTRVRGRLNPFKNVDAP